jgi:hypothetical protein
MGPNRPLRIPLRAKGGGGGESIQQGPERRSKTANVHWGPAARIACSNFYFSASQAFKGRTARLPAFLRHMEYYMEQM